MPRDGTDTRTRLLDEAERLFAAKGIHRPTVREIVEAAGQRNVSALTYHFGSRTGVLLALLDRHGPPVDAERGELLAAAPSMSDMRTRDLVAALLVPYPRKLATESGRNYLRIVAQLTDQFSAWRIADRTDPHLRRILGELERRAGGRSAVVRRERVINMIMLMTAAMGERARAIDEGPAPVLGATPFVTNLADVIVALLDVDPGELINLGEEGSAVSAHTQR